MNIKADVLMYKRKPAPPLLHVLLVLPSVPRQGFAETSGPCILALSLGDDHSLGYGHGGSVYGLQNRESVSSVFSQPKELMAGNGTLLKTCQYVGSPLVEDNVSVSSVGCLLASVKPVGFAGKK